jgi:hypothetical protein
MKLRWLVVLCFFIPKNSIAQYPGIATSFGSTAVTAYDTRIVAWANNCEVTRGWRNIQDTTLGKASVGNPAFACSAFDHQVVSLGDGGEAILQFDNPIINGSGDDFVVFENAFLDNFLELGFVEVSSDGIHYVRFCTHSLVPDSLQTGTFGLTEPQQIHNFAGKYISPFGTPFDLNELKYEPFLDVMNVHYVKIIDVVGCIDPLIASLDCYQNPVNDPFPTPFASSGFDLDAVGVLHNTLNTSIDNATIPLVIIAQSTTEIIATCIDIATFELFDINGKLIRKIENTSQVNFPFNSNNQLYFLRISNLHQSQTVKILH